MTSNVSAITSMFNAPQYTGELMATGQMQTTFLDAIGGPRDDAGMPSRVKVAAGVEFPLYVGYELEAASQPEISETDALTAGTPTTYVPNQGTNVVQIWRRDVAIGYLSASDINTLSGLYQLGNPRSMEDRLRFQKIANILQIARDMDHTFLNGAYNKATTVGTVNKTRGVLTAISTNKINASSTALTTAMMNQLLKSMYDNGSQMKNPVIWVNSTQKQRLTSLYSVVPMSSDKGGSNIQVISTDFGDLPIKLDPNVPQTVVAVLDMAAIYPVFLPVPDPENPGRYKGLMFYEPLGKDGAGWKGQIYGQAGIAYGNEAFHGQIYGLPSS